jgi:hypothetical protein
MSLKAAEVIPGNTNFHLRRETRLGQQGLRGQRLGQAGSAGQVAAHDSHRPHHLLKGTRSTGSRFRCQLAGSVRGEDAKRCTGYPDYEQNANQDAPFGPRELDETLQSPHAACRSSVEFKSARRASLTAGRRARIRGYATFFTGMTLIT